MLPGYGCPENSLPHLQLPRSLPLYLPYPCPIPHPLRNRMPAFPVRTRSQSFLIPTFPPLYSRTPQETGSTSKP